MQSFPDNSSPVPKLDAEVHFRRALLQNIVKLFVFGIVRGLFFFGWRKGPKGNLAIKSRTIGQWTRYKKKSASSGVRARDFWNLVEPGRRFDQKDTLSLQSANFVISVYCRMCGEELQRGTQYLGADKESVEYGKTQRITSRHRSFAQQRKLFEATSSFTAHG